MRIAPAHIDVPGVIPALCAVFQQVDGADGESHALNHRACTAGRQGSVRHEGQSFERPPRSQRAGSRKRVVDQMSALQMETPRANIPNFDRSVGIEALLYRSIPLLYVLRR